MSRHALENVLLFVPFGILVPLKSNFFKKWWNLILAAFISSLSIEMAQLITARGYFEIDDILLNTAGAVLGYMAFWVVYKSYIAVKHETKLPLSRHEQQLNRMTLFAIQLLPVILVVMLIFGFGSDDADRSSELSMFITEKLLYVINKILNLKWTAEKIHNAVPLYEGAVRKGAHITEFAMLTFFTFVFLYCRKIKNSLAFIFTFVFTAVIAVLDELNQLHIDGRSGSVKDVVIDCFGSAIVLFFILLMLSLARFYHWRRGGGKRDRRTYLNGSE
jgi:VanZ family protein